jgi:hypothetical protein
MTGTPGRRLVARGLAVGAGLASVGTVAAHGGSLGAAARETVTVPTWLFLLTGGAVIGASFLLASFVTDRSLIEAIHTWERRGSLPGRRALRALVRAVGVTGLFVTLAFGFLGPDRGLTNLGVLVVWVGWWAGFTMTTYLVGSTWTALNPWRTIAAALPSLEVDYPTSLGAWPSVAGLLVLIWLEVVSPLADAPRLLATVVLGYTVVTVAGAVAVGSETWFGTVDPVSRVFAYYGRVAPITRTDVGIAIRLPGTALWETELVDGPDEVAFVVAILWVTTYDGFVSTPAWEAIAGVFVRAGVPAHLLYPAVLALGFGLFYGVYRLAAQYSRRTGQTYLAVPVLARRFAPPLLAIAAGYHLAHYLAYFLSLAPTLVSAAATQPLALVSALVGGGSLPLAGPTQVPVLALPGWFSGVALGSVLLGHLLAIWIAHAAAFDLVPGRLQAIRSQYPFIVVMIFYTTTSLWIVSQPTIQPPFL